MENDFSVHSTGNSSEKKSPEKITFLDNENFAADPMIAEVHSLLFALIRRW